MSTKHKFNCGITGLRKAEKMSMTTLFLRTNAKETIRQERTFCGKPFMDFNMITYNLNVFFFSEIVVQRKLEY